MRQKEFFYTNGTFTVPANVNYVTIEAWGAGGTGGLSTRLGGRGGGGSGGAYAKTMNYPVNPGQGYTVTVGQGGAGNRDSWFDNINVVLARGGTNGGNSTGATQAYANGASGSIVGCVGDILFKGGNGGNGRDVGSGGGGGGAGTIENGGNASTNTGGVGGQTYIYLPLPAYGGGNGANGVSPGNNGLAGGVYGGGGSGGANTDLGFSTRNGGIGGNGLVVVTYSTQSLSPAIYSSCCDLEVGCIIHTDTSLTTLADAGTYYDGTNCLVVNDNGVITDLGSCTPVSYCLASVNDVFYEYWFGEPLVDNCSAACDIYTVFTGCYQNILIEAIQTGSFKYTTCAGSVEYGLIPSNAYYNPTSELYEYQVSGPCIRYNSVVTTDILPPIQPPAEIYQVVYNYAFPNDVCGSFSGSCGC
jgi:hypothetical protein